LSEPALWQQLSDAAPRPPDLAQFAAEHMALYRTTLAARNRPKVASVRAAAPCVPVAAA